MEHDNINHIYDQISKILKNDRKYTHKRIGESIVVLANALNNIEYYYEEYPPLLDVIEQGAALEHDDSEFKNEIINQIKYKMSELKMLLPDVQTSS